MKRLSLLAIAMALSLLVHSQDSTKNHRSALREGRTFYVSAGLGTSEPPHPSYDAGLEIGLWGIKKPTTFGLTFDNVRQDTVAKGTHWLGLKSYITLFGTPNASFMALLHQK